MASLRDTVKDYQDELRDGIAWVAFWKQGRSWNAEYFHLDMDDTLYPEDRSRLEEIKSTDPAAVILNGYYCGHLGEDMSLDELTAGVRYHYENSMNDIDGFIGAHDDRLPPEVIEEARAAAHEAGLPFSEKPYRDGEDFNPYVFDGSMSIEDFELMHRMIEKERSEQMAEPILSGYLSNLGKYTEGRPAGEWVTFPTTAEHLKEVFDRIGIDFKHYEEWHFTEFQSPIPGLAEHLSEYSHPDELNYLGKLLEMQFDDDREKFIAAIEYGDHADSLQDIINLAQNLDCYWIYPSVHNEEEYGRYLVDELEEPELPEEAKKYFMYEEYGRDASINDDGMFTEKGYIYNNRNTFTEWYDGRDVPQEYRVTPQPPQRSRPDPEKADFDAAAPGQRTAQTAEQPQEPRPVIPIVLTSEKPAEKLKEITDRLEQGIAELFDSERYKEYLKVMSKFHNYSFRNTVLIAMQKPDASLVAGFSAWKNNFERNVMKGQKGIKIIAPSPYKIKQEMQKIDPHTQKPIIGKDGKPVTEEKEVTIPAYKVVSVFDVSQTEGKELPDRVFDLSSAEAAQLRQIVRESENMDAYSGDFIRSYLKLLLLSVLRDTGSEKKRLKTPVALNHENEIVSRTLQYVADHVCDKLSVEIVSREVGVSASHLTALFHRQMNISPGEYIRRVKLEESKRLIREGTMNFSQIAAQLNYSTIHHFSRQFKDKFGMSPSEYAKSIQSE